MYFLQLALSHTTPPAALDPVDGQAKVHIWASCCTELSPDDFVSWLGVIWFVSGWVLVFALKSMNFAHVLMFVCLWTIAHMCFVQHTDRFNNVSIALQVASDRSQVASATTWRAHPSVPQPQAQELLAKLCQLLRLRLLVDLPLVEVHAVVRAFHMSMRSFLSSSWFSYIILPSRPEHGPHVDI